MAESFPTQHTPWSTLQRLSEDQWAWWRIGPFNLWVKRCRHEWICAHLHDGDSLTGGIEHRCPVDEPPPEDAESVRFGFSRSPGSVRIDAALPDRPMVVNPEVPFHLPPREETTLYVSTPVWIKLGAATAPSSLLEIPSHRPSDTWFGSSTREGELCYATRSRARLTLEEIEPLPHRAISEVHIRNLAETLLPVERLKLPAPSMPLYLGADGRLWTGAVTLSRTEDDERASIQLDDGPPAVAPDASRLSDPRKRMERRLLDRSFGGLIRDARR